jgi:flagellar biosynthesis protein FlhF
MENLFTGPDMKAALAAVRAELGDDAVILSSHKAPDGSFVIRAVLEETESEDGALPDCVQALDSSTRSRLLARLRGDISTQAPAQRFPCSGGELFALLRAERTPDRLALDLAEAAESTGLSDGALALARALDARMDLASLDVTALGAILIAGPQGSGKTTVAAKLAAEARFAGREVLLVATDTDGAGAIARLETFAEGIEADFLVVKTAEALKQAVAAAAETGTLLIADTCGFDPRADAAWRGFLALAKSGTETIAVLSALTDAEEAAEMAVALKALGAKRLVVTGADLTRRRGALIALAASGLTLAGLSRSPYLADGLVPVTPIALARDILAHAARSVGRNARAA